jgi:oligopeptide/dipeptide ABC transporter ATP-binding protein
MTAGNEPVELHVSDPLMDVKHLVVEYRVRRQSPLERRSGVVHAVSDVTFSVGECETLGVVGESGCGKSTLVRAMARLTDATSGTISFRGTDITRLAQRRLRSMRLEVQIVFQDPQSSLNPRRRVSEIMAAPFRLRGVPRRAMRAESEELFRRVGLEPDQLQRFPHEFSGGQRQRIGIARALAAGPRLLLLDEPVSALDVSIQAQVINLLKDLQDEYGLSYVLVAHDLAVVRHVSDRIIVMYLGKIVESAAVDDLYARPIHPYTVGLLEAIPVPDPRQNRERSRVVLGGEPPNPLAPPAGCRFCTRCQFVTEICTTVEPPLLEYANGHMAACHHPQSVVAAEVSAARGSAASPAATTRSNVRTPAS